MNIGGIQITCLPTEQPSRIIEPPGTIRTLEAASNLFTGNVDLSKKGWRDTSIDISTIVPIRNPTRIPFFTQVLTRHPERADRSGSAARASPEFKEFLKSWNRRTSS